MRIPVVDTVNHAKASTMLAGQHFASAVRVAGDMKAAAPDSPERRLAAARVMDEVDHGVIATKDVPGVGFIPYAGPALTAYSIARKLLMGVSHTPVGNDTHPVLAAANLLGASEHLQSAMEIHAEGHVSRAERMQAVMLVDEAISDAKLGYRLARHPQGEAEALAILTGTRQLVDDRRAVDPATITTATQLLEQAATAAFPGA
ncbi:MAG: hypothetical protein JWM86_429 [Thermoleophilia bacterium]|nr:hypothetical protein [Thermoleophilia bacterium]